MSSLLVKTRFLISLSPSPSPICLSRVRLQTELDKVFLPINHKNYNFQEKKNSQVMKEKKENLR